MASGGNGGLAGSVTGRPLLTFRIECPPFCPRTAIMSAAAQKTSASPARVVILISGRGSNMMALVEAIEQQKLPVEVAGVISNRPDAAGLAWAKAANADRKSVV